MTDLQQQMMKPPAGHDEADYRWDTPEERCQRSVKVRAETTQLAATFQALAHRLSGVDVIAPYYLSLDHVDGGLVIRLSFRAATPDALRELMRAFAPAMRPGTTWTKDSNGSWPSLRRWLRDVPVVIELDAMYGRCERVEVGSEPADVSVEVCPVCESDLIEKDTRTSCMAADCGWMMEAPKRVQRTVPTPKFETRCPDLLADVEEPTDG